MFNPKKRTSVTAFTRRPRNYGLLKLMMVSGMLISAMLLMVVFVQAFQYSTVKQKVASLHVQISEDTVRNENLKQEVERLHDPAHLELLARKYLGFVKPDETVYHFKD